MVFSVAKACIYLAVSAMLTGQALSDAELQVIEDTAVMEYAKKPRKRKMADVGMKKTLLSLYQDPPTIVNGTYSSFVFATYDAVLRSSKGGPIVGNLYGTTTVNTALDDTRDRHV